MAIMYLQGIGVDKDVKEAMKWVVKRWPWADYAFQLLSAIPHILAGATILYWLRRLDHFFQPPVVQACELPDWKFLYDGDFEAHPESKQLISTPASWPVSMAGRIGESAFPDSESKSGFQSPGIDTLLVWWQIPLVKLGRYRDRLRELTAEEITTLAKMQEKFEYLVKQLKHPMETVSREAPEWAAETGYLINTIRHELEPALKSNQGRNLMLDRLDRLIHYLEQRKKAVKCKGPLPSFLPQPSLFGKSSFYPQTISNDIRLKELKEQEKTRIAFEP